MTKQEFLSRLKSGLSGLPRDEADERIGFYEEMIDDRIEEGISEEEAVAGIGSVDDIVRQIIEDIPLAKLVKERVRPRRSLKGWEIALMILSSPLWFPLGIAALIIVLSLYIVLWAGIVCLWAIDLSFALVGVCGAPYGLVCMATGNRMSGFLSISCAFICAGLAVVCFFGCRESTKGAVMLAKRITSWIKSRFIRKENR